MPWEDPATAFKPPAQPAGPILPPEIAALKAKAAAEELEAVAAQAAAKVR